MDEPLIRPGKFFPLILLHVICWILLIPLFDRWWLWLALYLVAVISFHVIRAKVSWKANKNVGLLVFYILTFSDQGLASSPDRSSSEIRRPLPFLLPDMRPKTRAVLYHFEVNHGRQQMLLDDGSFSSEINSFGGHTVLGTFRISEAFALSGMVQASAANMFHMNFGVQTSFQILQFGSHSWHIDGLYSGSFIVLGPSAGIQTYYRFRAFESESAIWSASAGPLISMNYQYVHRVRDKGVFFPSERYVGYLVQQGGFVGLSATVSKFAGTLQAGYLKRRAVGDDDGTVFTADNGPFAAFNFGMSLP